MTSCRILALDGGGIRGIFSAAVLSALEEDLNVSVADYFDLVCGTSTGGIIALGIGLGLSPQTILKFYERHGPKIFPRFRTGLFRAKYRPGPLETALRDGEVFGQRTLGESGVRLVIPSFNARERDVYLFRTRHHPRLSRDFRVPAWKVAMATTAAPSFFPAFRALDRMRLVDGAVWANNPTMVGVMEAFHTLGVPLEGISVLSIGTLSTRRAMKGYLDWAGRLLWARHAPDLIMDANSLGVQKQASLLLGPDRYYRIDPEERGEGIALDDARNVDELVASAAHQSRIDSPAVSAAFFSERVDPFEPIPEAL